MNSYTLGTETAPGFGQLGDFPHILWMFGVKQCLDERKQSTVCKPMVIHIRKNKMGTEAADHKDCHQYKTYPVQIKKSSAPLFCRSKFTVQNKNHRHENKTGKYLIHHLQNSRYIRHIGLPPFLYLYVDMEGNAPTSRNIHLPANVKVRYRDTCYPESAECPDIFGINVGTEKCSYCSGTL